MGKRKIINDPIYGFIQFEFDLIYDLIDHPYFQRLRRISQMGLSSFVYPGAVHSRFHHALGALHLMTKAIRTLKSKGIEITEEEAEAVSIAILLHDIGHGPFSHTLEGVLLPFHHEEITLQVMEMLNNEFDGKLTLAIAVFKNDYQKQFLHQLVSSQLDMDRMDYLIRDSFFSGVAEGVIGYDRIINMLNVVNDKIVIEEKAIYSVEKFMLSRSMMYWQVYLHKTCISAEQMLIKFVELIKEDYKKDPDFLRKYSNTLDLCISQNSNISAEEKVKAYLKLDDYDIYQLMKIYKGKKDKLIDIFIDGLLERKLFKIILKDSEFSSDFIGQTRQKIVNYLRLDEDLAEYLILRGKESNQTYNIVKDEIIVLSKNGDLSPLSERSNILSRAKLKHQYFLCYPKNID